MCRGLALNHQETCLGTHSNLVSYGAPTFWRNPIISLKLFLGSKGLPGGYSDGEMAGLQRMQEFLQIGNAYMRQQGTRPQVRYSYLCCTENTFKRNKDPRICVNR